VECRRGAVLVELAVASHCRVGGQALDLHPAALELRDNGGVGAQTAVGSDTQNEPRRKLIEHLVQVLDSQRVALAPPPIGHHTVGQHDEIAGVLMAVDGEPPEAVVLQTSGGVSLPL
jgi:hypothetical protein